VAPASLLVPPPAILRAQSILFCCSENAIRSPMAVALTRAFLGRSIYLDSAGVRPGQNSPFVTAVMAEIGLDLSRHRPKTFEDLEETSFDLIVSLSPEAHHRALEFTRTMAVEVNYWPTFDPTGVEGSRGAVMDAFRVVRDTIDRRVRADFAQHDLKR
jgi:protein-tyrosine-phosphatase